MNQILITTSCKSLNQRVKVGQHLMENRCGVNILIEIEYDGTNYSGWQYQPNKRTIQGELEKALRQIGQAKIKIIGASRTDAGVSALEQIANFHISAMQFKNIPSFRNGINALLPNDIYVRKMKIIAKEFHSRYSSKGKVYLYQIITEQSPLRKKFAWVLPYELDLSKMRNAAKLFVKHDDYKLFCSVKDKNGMVLMKSIKINKATDEIYIKIEANRFLYKMVRRIVGALVEIGRGHRTEYDIMKGLAGEKHRPLICAPANGLILVKVKY